MKFKGLEKNSLIEWPGKVVAVAYTGGCNFRCPYCQNSDLVLKPGEIPGIGEEEILDHLRSKEKWLDGLIVTGGEPTLHPSLFNFSQKVKNEGFVFGVETNGTNFDVLKELIEKELVDRIALDIKAPLNWSKYKKAIGVDDKDLFENVKKSIELLQDSDISHEFRTTVVPKLLDTEDLEKIGKKIKGSKNFYLQQFTPQNTLDQEFEKVEPYPESKLKEIQKKLKEKYNLEPCKIRNI